MMDMMDVITALPVAEGRMIGGVRGMEGGAGPPAMGGDAFSRIFARLAAALGTDGQEQTLESLLWLPFDEAQKDEKKLSLFEMLVAMLEMPQAQLQYRELSLVSAEDGGVKLDFEAVREAGTLNTDRLGEWLSAGGGPVWTEGADPQEAEALVESRLATLPQEPLPKPAEAQEHWEAGVRSAGYPAETKEALEEIGGTPVKVLGYQGPERNGEDGESVLRGQEQFRQAVREAQSKLAEKDAKTVKGDSRAAESAAGESAWRILAGGGRAEAGPQEAPGIPDQIFLGLSQNLKAGRGEFVIKLVPEGLGEITVKLLARDGRTTLRLITASAETARLINQDLAALQNALKPIRVEVREAVPETPEAREAEGYFTGFDQFNQFNQYGNQRDQNLPSGGARAARIPGDGDGAAAEPAGAAYRDSEVDLYV